MQISGRTRLIAHLGYPTESFKAPMIYNPYFQKYAIDAVVVPMGCKAENYEQFLKALFKLSNIHGALVTMPHKISTVALMDDVSKTAKVAGACNAIYLGEDGKLVGDMFDGEGFVRGVLRKGRVLTSARAFVTGCGGVGSAIAASLAKAGVSELSIFDVHAPSMNNLAERLRKNYPQLQIRTGSNDPAGYDVVVNASPIGMNADDPLPMDVTRISPSSFVGEVVMKHEITPFLAAARAQGCEFQIGTDMLFEQIPAYLEFFGFRSTNADELRSLAQIEY